MSTQNLSILHAFQSFSRKCKSQFLQSCPKEFIRFLSECIVNILQGNLQSVKRHHVIKYKRELHLLSLKRTTWKQRRDLLTSERGLQLVDTITPFVINHLSWYGTVCPRTCFTSQQAKHNKVHDVKSGPTQISTSTNSYVPSWFTENGY